MKFYNKKISVLGLLLFICLCISSVHAALVYDWYVTNPEQTVGPNDTVQIDATIFNDATSTVNFDLDAAITAAVVSSFPGAYDPVFGDGNTISILTQFNGIVLTPGESFNFVFATLTPDPAPVPAGDYYVLFPGLVINGVTDYWQVLNPFYDSCAPYCNQYQNGVAKITVTGGDTGGGSTSVPEPGSLALMSLGLAALGLSRRKRFY